MNSLLLTALLSCPPVAAYPDPGPAQGDPINQGRARLFGWLRGHHRHAGGSGLPAAPVPASTAGPAEAVTVAPAPAVVPRPACNCAGNGYAGGSWPPVAPAPTVLPPPTTAGPAPRLVPRPQPVTTSAEPPLAVPPDGAPRQMPRGSVGTT